MVICSCSSLVSASDELVDCCATGHKNKHQMSPVYRDLAFKQSVLASWEIDMEDHVHPIQTLEFIKGQ